MTEKSFGWSAGGQAGDGAATYTRQDIEFAMKVVAACQAFEGVAPAYLNALAVTVAGANTVQVDTGGAMVDGRQYWNTAAVSVNIPSASGGGNTRIDRVVLRASWSAQTVRVTRIPGTDAASPTAPAITQSSETTYDIKLAQVLVNTSGTCVVTDERTFAQLTSLNSIAAALITGAKLAANTVDTGQMALNSVDDTIAGNRVPQFYRRQGASATDWSSGGTSTQTPTSVRMQAGVHAADSIINGNTQGTTITFPVAFSNPPIVIVTPFHATQAVLCRSMILTPTATQVSVSITNEDGATRSIGFHWMAIGPE